MSSKKVWKPIAGTGGTYEVSSVGGVRSLDRVVFVKQRRRMFWKHLKGVELQPAYDNQGYQIVNIHGKTTAIHRLVANAFIKKERGKKHVNHKDGNKSNNEVSNLEWCTPRENVLHARKSGLYPPPHNVKPVEMLDKNNCVVRRFSSIHEASAYFDKRFIGNIVSVCRGNRLSCCGYGWRYAE